VIGSVLALAELADPSILLIGTGSE
jgi:hypothetical protein